MGEQPRVSVVMIFLNAERFFEEAVESVRNQTFNNWEMVLVDDGSTDGTTTLARRYAATYPERIRYVEHPGHVNRGMSASRNRGVLATTGDYVAFLDADDTWLPSKLADQVALLDAHPKAAMVYGQGLVWRSWTGRPEDQDRTYPLGVPADTLVAPPILFTLLLENKAQSPMTGNVLLRREIYDAVGGFEESFRGMYEDQVFFAKVHLHAPTFVAGTRWLMYRQHPESCTAKAEQSESYLDARRPFIEWLAGYMEAEGVNPAPEAWMALRKALRPYRHPIQHHMILAFSRLKGRLRNGGRRIG